MVGNTTFSVPTPYTTWYTIRMKFEAPRSTAEGQETYAKGDIVRIKPSSLLFEAVVNDRFFEITSVSTGPKGKRIVLGRIKGTNEEPVDLSLENLEKVTIH